jgi:hypothetical protein
MTTDEQWLPLGVEGDDAVTFTAPWIELPDWFQESLWQWILRNLFKTQYAGEVVSVRVDLLRQAERVLHISLPVFEDHRINSGPPLVRSRFNELGTKSLLAFVDFLMAG